MTLVLPSALLLLLVAIEAFVLRVVQRKDVPWNQVVFNLNSGHTVLWLFRGLEIAVFHEFSSSVTYTGALMRNLELAWDFSLVDVWS